jgi:hypothetical protein
LKYLKAKLCIKKGTYFIRRENLCILLPSRDSDGFFRMNPEFLFVYLPSEISNYLLDKVIIEDFENKEATMIRLGTLEDFENQPIELTEPVLGEGFCDRHHGILFWQKVP